MSASTPAPCPLDTEPATLAELEDRRRVYRLQTVEAMRCEHDVTCPCGRVIRLWAAYRCRCCGLRFCPVCAIRHFGLEEEVVDGMPRLVPGRRAPAPDSTFPPRSGSTPP